MKPGKSYYGQRLAELESLFNKSQSETSKSLLGEAIQLTQHASAQCERITKLANERIVFYDNKKKKFDEFLKQMNEATAKINAASTIELLSQETKNKILSAGEAMAKDLLYQYDIRNNANRELRTAIDKCNADLNRTLLELIFKPNSSTFILDAVVSILGQIITGLIPYSDTVEMVLETNITNKKRKYLESGDKLLVYIEDYINVLKVWLLLSDEFEKRVLE
jgi:hypothetical protein